MAWKKTWVAFSPVFVVGRAVHVPELYLYRAIVVRSMLLVAILNFSTLNAILTELMSLSEIFSKIMLR